MVSQNLVIAGAPTTMSRDTSWREIPGHFALTAPERKSGGDAKGPENVYSKVGGEFKGREVDL